MPFPRDEASVNAMLQAWLQYIAELKTTFNLTVEQVADITSMAQLFNYFFVYFGNFNDQTKSAFDVKKAVFEGLKPNQAVPQIPNFTPMNPPESLMFNIIGKARAYRTFFLKHPNYSESFGALLKIAEGEDDGGGNLPDTLETELEAVGLDNFEVEVIYKRNGFPGALIQQRLQGENDGAWKFATNGLGGTARFTVTPTAGNKPVTVELRGKHLNAKGAPVGTWSQIETVIAHA